MGSHSDSIQPGAVPARPSLSRRRGRLPLHLYIAALFMLLIIGVGGVIAWRNYVENRQLIISASQDLVQAIGGKTVAAFTSIHRPAEMLIDLLARQRLGQATNLADRIKSVAYLADALKHSPSLSALYIGYGNGDFFLVRPLRENVAVRAQFKAPATAAYLVQSIEHGRAGETRGTYVFLDKEQNVLERRDAPDYAFDPRTRGWYQEAIAAQQQIKTAPYVFFSTGDVGLTFARRSDVGIAAVGADLTLRDLSDVLQQQRLTPSSELVLFNADGVALAYDKPERMRLDSAQQNNPRLARVEELGSPMLVRVMEELRAGAPITKLGLNVAGREWEGSVSRLQVEGEPRGIYLAVLSPQDELLTEARRISRDTVLITLVIVLVSIPVAWLLSRLVATPLRSLVREARAIREFDFAAPISARSIVAEVDELAGTMDAMKVTMRNFLDIAGTISAEHNFQRLLERVLGETIAAAGSAAGAIYLCDDDGRALKSAALRARSDMAASLSIAEVNAALCEHPVWRAFAEATTVVAPLDSKHDDLTRLLDPRAAQPGEPAFTAIAVPLRNRGEQIIGV